MSNSGQFDQTQLLITNLFSRGQNMISDITHVICKPSQVTVDRQSAELQPGSSRDVVYHFSHPGRQNCRPHGWRERTVYGVWMSWVTTRAGVIQSLVPSECHVGVDAVPAAQRLAKTCIAEDLFASICCTRCCTARCTTIHNKL